MKIFKKRLKSDFVFRKRLKIISEIKKLWKFWFSYELRWKSLSLLNNNIILFRKSFLSKKKGIAGNKTPAMPFYCLNPVFVWFYPIKPKSIPRAFLREIKKMSRHLAVLLTFLVGITGYSRNAPCLLADPSLRLRYPASHHGSENLPPATFFTFFAYFRFKSFQF